VKQSLENRNILNIFYLRLKLIFYGIYQLHPAVVQSISHTVPNPTMINPIALLVLHWFSTGHGSILWLKKRGGKLFHLGGYGGQGASRRGRRRWPHNTGRYHCRRFALGGCFAAVAIDETARTVRLHSVLLTAQLGSHLLVPVLLEHVGHGDHILTGLVVEQTVLNHALKVPNGFLGAPVVAVVCRRHNGKVVWIINTRSDITTDTIYSNYSLFLRKE
jgi:hypothetical protein